jgi:hypothetical protein
MVVVFTSNVAPYETYPQSAILFDFIIPAAVNTISQNIDASNTLTLATLALLPLPILLAGVYFRVRTRRWFWKLTYNQEV